MTRLTTLPRFLARFLVSICVPLCALTLSMWACADGTGLGRNRSGTFALVAFEGKVLPATVADLVQRDFTPSGCFERVTSGWLTLDARTVTFSYGAHREDSCGRTSFGNDTSAFGRYEIDGSEILLYGVAGPGIVELVRAHVGRTTIELRDHSWQYRFAR